jgi:hypothetical protein
MELVSILRVLRRRRRLVALGALLSLLAGVAIVADAVPVPEKLAGRDSAIGAATGRVLLAAAPQRTVLEQSQLTDSIALRGQLLANLMATEDVRSAIARAVGIPPDQVSIRGPSSRPPAVETSLAVEAANAAMLSYAAYGLEVSADLDVPIISFKATGPDAAGATRIVEAATGQLGELIAVRTTDTPKIRVAPLGPPVERTIVESAHPAIGIGVALVAFVLWCAGVIVVSGLTRRGGGRPAGSPEHVAA